MVSDNENINLDESKNNKSSFSYKKIGVLILLIVLILLVVGFVWWYNQDKKAKDAAKKSALETAAEKGCGKIYSIDGETEGMSPWNPIVKAKLTGNFPKDKEICHWTVNDEDLGYYKPYGEYCVLYDLNFIQLGYYKVSLDVDGLENCPKEILLKVTSLNQKETEEQAKIIEKIEAGATVEEIELLESHKIRRY